jgi:hypothetical protein
VGVRWGPKSEPGNPSGNYPRVWLQDENRWGCGEADEHGIYSWYEPVEHTLPSLVHEQWPLIEADLHQIYGIDTGSGIFSQRTWGWLKARILGLLTCECRLQRKLSPPPPEPPKAPTRR